MQRWSVFAEAYRPVARFTTALFALAHHRLVDIPRQCRHLQSLDAAAEDGSTLLNRLAVEEIAHAAGVNFEAAKSRLRYARSRLSQALSGRTHEQSIAG